MLTLPTIAAVIALISQQVLGDTFASINILPRQLGGMSIPTNIDAECVATCSRFSDGVLKCTTDTLTCMCSPTLATPFRDCLQCLVGHGMTATDASSSVTGFAEGCKALGYPLTITSIGGGAATNSAPASHFSSASFSRPIASSTPQPSPTAKSDTEVNDDNQGNVSDSPFGANNSGSKGGNKTNSSDAIGFQTSTTITVLSLAVTLIRSL